MVGSSTGQLHTPSTRAKYENITLPKESRGREETIVSMFMNLQLKQVQVMSTFLALLELIVVTMVKRFPNYFNHTRIEDMADDQTRRVIRSAE